MRTHDADSFDSAKKNFHLSASFFLCSNIIDQLINSYIAFYCMIAPLYWFDRKKKKNQTKLHPLGEKVRNMKKEKRRKTKKRRGKFLSEMKEGEDS